MPSSLIVWYVQIYLKRKIKNEFVDKTKLLSYNVQKAVHELGCHRVQKYAVVVIQKQKIGISHDSVCVCILKI